VIHPATVERPRPLYCQVSNRFYDRARGKLMGDGRRLALLVTAHLILWLLSAVLAPVKVHTPFGLQHILIVPLFAVTFSQVCLLGIWAVLSPFWSWYRLLGLVIGTACLEAALDIALGQEFLLMPSVGMALTVVSLLVVRGFGIRLSRFADDVPSSRQEPQGFRFSIRGLMILTAVVALLSATAKGVQGSPGPFRLVLSVIWSICFVAVSLLSLRAASGNDGPLRRGLPAVAVSPALGAFFAYAADAHRDGWIYVITIMLLYPAVLLGSLLVVRSCGYHLTRRSVPGSGPLEFATSDPANADPEDPTPSDAAGNRR